MKKDIKSLEKKLKEITGEDELQTNDISEIKSKKKFNSSKFMKLANDLKKIFLEDEQYSNSAIKPL